VATKVLLYISQCAKYNCVFQLLSLNIIAFAQLENFLLLAIVTPLIYSGCHNHNIIVWCDVSTHRMETLRHLYYYGYKVAQEGLPCLVYSMRMVLSWLIRMEKVSQLCTAENTCSWILYSFYNGHFWTDFFLFVIQRLSFLRGKNVLRWTCWDRNSLSLVQNSESPLREVPLYFSFQKCMWVIKNYGNILLISETIKNCSEIDL